MDPVPARRPTATDLRAGLYARSDSARTRARRLIALQPALNERSRGVAEASREILLVSAAAAARATTLRLELAARRALADSSSTAGSKPS